MLRSSLALAASLCFCLPAFAQPAGELALIRAVFAKLQPISIRQNREYCGYVGYDSDGNLRASRAARGNFESCEPDDPTEIEVIVASYHTHGAFSTDYHNEVPSAEDIEGDEAEGIDGYVATPGGRLWYVDTEAMSVSQICGIGCLPTDPRFVSGDGGRIADVYAYDDLVEKLDE